MPPFLATLLATFAALFPITNPFGNAGIFLSLTGDSKPAERRVLALRGAFFMLVILEVFLFAGGFLLHFFGLSLEGIRIAGGLLIGKIGFDQLQPKRESTHTDEEHAEARQKEDIAFSPLAMPLLAGPGAIASVMSMASLAKSSSPAALLPVAAGIVLACLVCWIVLRESDLLMRVLGVNGMNALTRIMGFLLLCIGVQLAIDGVMALSTAHSGS